MDNELDERLGYGTALLAVFLSSVLQGVLYVAATVLGIGFGLFLGWLLGMFVGAVLLRLCLGFFGWTISLKAAALTRFACGLISGLVVGAAYGLFLADTSSPADPAALSLAPEVFIAGGILELVLSALVVTFLATRLPNLDNYTPWTPASEPEVASSSFGAPVYSTEDFLADSPRARARG